jgi:hypothetical protein
MLLHFNQILDKRDALFKLVEYISLAMPDRATNKEMTLLVNFFMLPDKFKYHRFSSAARKRLKKTLKEQGGGLAVETINTYIYSLIRKGYLYRDEDRMIYTKALIKKELDALIEAYDKEEPYSITLKLTPKVDGTNKTTS